MILRHFAFFALMCHGAAASTAPGKPSFVQHVNREMLQEALSVAQQLHNGAVQQALSNYPTNLDPKPVDTERLDQVKLKEYKIEAPGQLPDFSDILPRAVYVTDPTPLFTKEECADVIRMAEAHFAKHNNGEWTKQQSGQYEVTGFLIREIPAVQEWFIRQCQTRLFPLLARQFPEFCQDPEDLCVDNAYMFRYTPETGRRSDIHTDSGCLSFTISLNEPHVEYQGGGTWFEGLQGNGGSNVLEMTTGKVTIRPGGVKHAGHAVESGVRYIIGGFCMHQKRLEPVRMLLNCPDTSAKYLEAAVALNPGCDLPYNLLANSYEKVAHDAKKAQQVLEYCQENVHPSSGEIAYALGSLYMDQNLYDKVLACTDICLAADDCDVDAMMAAAQAHAKLGHDSQERSLYEKIVATPGASVKVQASAYCNLGVLNEGRDTELHFYRQSLKLVPNSFAPRYSLGCAYASRQDWKQAVDCFRQAVDDADCEVHGEKALKGLYRAAAFLLQGENPASASKEAMIERFKEIMGAENWDEVSSGAGR